MENVTAVEGRHLVKTFGVGPTAVHALNDVSIAIRRGEFFTLLGPSGCGKTTLLRLIAGFELPTSGELLLGGQSIAELPPNRRRVNTVFQSYALFPHLTVAGNIGFGLKMLGRPAAEVRARVAEMLALVQLEALADRRPAQMSGGQQQRVALARALAPAPEVLLLDEPLSALDAKLRRGMQEELKALQAKTGITFVFVTHDQEEALTMSDRIAVMSAGRIQQVGTPREIYATPANRFVADFIGETNFLPATVAGSVATLSGGVAIPVGSARQGPVTLAIRPEHLRLDPDGPFPARVDHAVYFGTDSRLHLRLGDGSMMIARLPAGIAPPDPGTDVRLSADELQILEAE